MNCYCEECKKKTEARWLDCEEHGGDCQEVICCDCGSSINDKYVEDYAV